MDDVGSKKMTSISTPFVSPPPSPIVFNDVYIFVGPIFRFEIRFDFFYEVLLEWG